MKRKIIITIIAFCTMLFALGMINASAETEGIYTYSVSNGEVSITDCDVSTSGEIVIPDTLGDYPVTSIGDSAFCDCSSLVSIIIPDGVTNIGVYAFGDCSSLVSITIPDSVTSIGDSAFCDCSSLVGITIPDSVTNIGISAFEDCSSLVSITIPDSVTNIGDSTFSGCSSLVSITIPDSVTNIGDSAFWGCSGLTKVNITDIEAWCNIEFGNYSATPLHYAKKLYLNNSLVTNLTIPYGVTSIGDYAFSGCSSLVSITIPDSVTNIGDSAFSGCSSLVSITIPDSVTNIGDSAFRSCRSLVSITIPDSVTNIGVYAFSYCSSLLGITIPDSVTSIGDSAFQSCSSLVSITIPDSVTSIGDSAFYGCSRLKFVCLPQEIKYIKNDAFNECSDIKTVFYEGNESDWSNILFYSRNEDLTNAKIVYNATKKIYKFVTNCDKALNDITDYAIFTMPTVENAGMTFTGWYDNESLSGEPVTFPFYGDATTLYAAWTDRTGKSFEDAFIAKANQEYTVSTTENGQYVYFEFVPKLSKEYRFYTTGSKDTYGYLYDGNQSRLTSDDDSGDGNNFYISYKLSAGQTYYIAAKLYSGTGTITFVVEEPVDYRINEITIKDMSGNSLQAIPTGTFLATVSFTNVSSSEDTVIVLAQYTDVGAFKGLMYIQTEDVPTGSTLKLSIPVDNSSGDVAKLKAFCWDSFGSVIPLGNSVNFPTE